MEEKIKNWIIVWFEENTDIEKDEMLNALDENYFTNEWIDSFKFILFLNEIENGFGISFSNDEFQGKEFSTINGLVKLIGNKTNA
jgi:acyl carrier protein